MGAFVLIILLFVVLVGGGWSLAKSFANLIFREEKTTFVDKSVTNVYHTHLHQHRNISIIDDATKEKILNLNDDKD